jgi:hypothetical protein
MRRTLLPLVVILLFAISAHARVIRVEVTSRGDVSNGRYELLRGRIHFAADPANPHNTVVVDLDKAPRNAEGAVEFSADFFVLRPKVGSNDVLFFDVSNRGGTSMLYKGEPTESYLTDHGFTIAAIGWQFDTRPGDGQLLFSAPVATGVHGFARSDFVVYDKRNEYTVAHYLVGTIGGTGYPVEELAAPGATLTERDAQTAPRRTIPRAQWRFVDPKTVHYDGGFVPGRIYEVVYPAKDPAVAGAGLAAVRDFVSWCKHDPKTIAPAKYAYGFGISQTGRLLRHFVYQGFNADESGRQVFDGLLVLVAGAGRGNFNHRFAQPSRDANSLSPGMYPVDIFPFADLPTTDPYTHVTAGLLDKARAENVVPKIFYMNTEYAYWSRGESLTHTTPDGKADVEIPATSRIYYLPGFSHINGPWPPERGKVDELRGTELDNPNDYWTVTRALMDDMDAWVRKGVEPPPSQIPHISDGTLVPATPAQPKPYTPYVVDFGPDFGRGVLREPPHALGAYPVLVPKTDADGNALGGVRQPVVDVPVATYTGWNLRDPAIGFGDVRAGFIGSYLPWPKSKLLARYTDRTHYLGLYTEAALKMLKARFLLPDDMAPLLTEGATRWDYATKER